MSARWRRRVIWGTVALALVGALAYGYRPQPHRVEIARAQVAPMQVTVDEEGETRIIDHYIVSAPIPGFARRSRFKVGDHVSAGDVLVELEPMRPTVLDPRARAEAQARVAAAAAALRAAEQDAEAARSEAELAETGLRRVRELVEKSLASQDQLDQANTRVLSTRASRRSAEFVVDVARFELEAANTALKYSGADDVLPAEIVRLRAPVDGDILKLYQESAAAVAAASPLVEIGNPRSLEAVVDVLSADAVRIEPGMRVIFKRWGGGPPLEGRVRRVEPVGFTKISALGVEEQRVNVISDFVSPPEQWVRLGDAYRVDASFVIWERDKALQIPASALFRHGNGWAVFVVADGAARLRTVEIGHRSGLLAHITEGLEAGETVITHPNDSIGDGTRVEPLNNDS